MDTIPNLYRQIAEQADPWPAPVFTIYVVDKLKVSWGQVLAGLNQTFKKTPGSPSDPRLRTNVVGTSDVVQTVAAAARKDIWGGLEMGVFGSMDEALAHVREQVRVASDG